ncbi:MAG: hypothetical protein ACK4NF_05230, partial [Planctomycetota bacterium]
MSKKMIGRISIIILVISGCSIIYSQASISCSNTLNTISQNYQQCKKSLLDDVAKILSPLISERDALKKELDNLTKLLNNYEAEKDKLTKSISALENEIKTKGCVNCDV